MYVIIDLPIPFNHSVYNFDFEDPDPFNEGFHSDVEAMQKEREELQSRQSNLEDEDEDKANQMDEEESYEQDPTKRYELMNTRDSEIAIMEKNLERVKLLEAEASSVGHLTDSRDDLWSLRQEEERSEQEAGAKESATGVFSQVKSEEEMREADEKREKVEEVKRKEKEKRYRALYKPTVTVNPTKDKDKEEEKKEPYRFQVRD